MDVVIGQDTVANCVSHGERPNLLSRTHWTAFFFGPMAPPPEKLQSYKPERKQVCVTNGGIQKTTAADGKNAGSIIPGQYPDRPSQEQPQRPPPVLFHVA